MEKTLDVREMVPKDRHANIFKTFNDLNANEAFILINDHEPRPLLYQFQNEHNGEFDWWPLEQGPEVWRVSIGSRKTPEPERTVTEYMQADHKRLDRIYNNFQTAIQENRWEDASGYFDEFSLGLKRHIKAEEDILFPAFEEKTGMHDGGPTAVMRIEHKDIHVELDRLLDGTDGKDAALVSDASDALRNLLLDHNAKEEQILYPESDHFLSNSERCEFIRKAQAV